MSEPLPKWEMIRYALLWKKFQTKEFSGDDAQRALNEKDRHLLSVFFYDLQKAGWIEIKRARDDKRKKIYKLEEPNNVIACIK